MLLGIFTFVFVGNAVHQHQISLDFLWGIMMFIINEEQRDNTYAAFKKNPESHFAGFGDIMSLDARKPVFRVSDQVRHKPACTRSEKS